MDVCFKVVYLFKSRFASIELKRLYQMILILRPALIGALILYVILVKIKTVYVNWRRGKKKFKDDIAY